MRLGLKGPAERRILLTPRCLSDIRFWVETEPGIAQKALELMEAVRRDPFRGMGKPEPLKRDLAGLWSRRITLVHRLVYEVKGDTVIFHQARYHY